MGLHIGRDGIKGGYTMRVLGAIANHSSPLPRDFLPPILGGATCHKFILFLYFERKIFVKSTMRSLKYLSSNMFANFNCVRRKNRGNVIREVLGFQEDRIDRSTTTRN